MFIPTAELNTFIEPAQNSNRQNNSTLEQTLPPLDLLQAVIEGFVDGILIVTQGELVHANEYARRICSITPGESQLNSVLQEVWQVCVALIESNELFPGQKVIIESELEIDGGSTFRVRPRWLNLTASDCAQHTLRDRLLLVTLEAQNQSIQNTAIADVKRYNLTPREAEVWLLRCTNHSYKEIAAKLYITLNTVKKHLKNIYAKQQEFLWNEE